LCEPVEVETERASVECANVPSSKWTSRSVLSLSFSQHLCVGTINRNKTTPSTMQSVSLFILPLIVALFLVAAGTADAVVVDVTKPSNGPRVTRDHKYRSMVTLYIENDDGGKTPSGWSTRKEHGAAADSPFEFQPGVNLIVGWSEGVLQMNEGERALLHIPSAKGYGGRPMGSKGGAFYIPADSNLLFDIEILGKTGSPDL
jgi:hypothetical protein